MAVSTGAGGLVWLVGLLLQAGSLASSEPVLVERILAVVDGRPLLLSEVRVVERLRGLSQKEALEALIAERLMLREAARLSQTTVSPEEEDRALRALQADTPAARGLPERELRRLVRRQAAILKYIDFRFRPQVSVADQDLQRAYQEAHAGRSDPPPLESEAPALRERLLARAMDQKIEAWVAELRKAADVRYNP